MAFGKFSNQIRAAAKSFGRGVFSVGEFISNLKSIRSTSDLKKAFSLSRESADFKEAVNFAPIVKRNELVGRESQVLTERLQTEKFRYLFNQTVSDNTGALFSTQKVSLLSSKRLTPNEAMDKLSSQIHLHGGDSKPDETFDLALNFLSEIVRI